MYSRRARLILLLTLACASPVFASAIYSGTFPSGAADWHSSTECCGSYYFYTQGAYVEEHYDTGLAYLTGLDLELPYSQHSQADIGFALSLNGVVVGDWLVPPGHSNGSLAALSFTFPEIVDLDGLYDLRLFVTLPSCANCGSVALSLPGDLTLHGVPIPEPSTLALLGPVMLLVARRRQTRP